MIINRLLIYYSVLIGMMIVFDLGCSCSNNMGDAEKEQAFKQLIHEWNINLPVDYKVINYKEDSFRDEYGCVLRYFRLELTRDQAQSLLKNPQLGAGLYWNGEKKFLEIRPPINWWKAERNMNIVRGAVVSDDKTQYIDFSVIHNANNSYILVKCLGRKGETKSWEKWKGVMKISS